MRSNFYLAAFGLLVSSAVEAHTWLENIMLIGSNGSFVGQPGYPRGYGPRLPGVDPDAQNVYELQNFKSTDLMCKSTQTIGTYTSGYGPLTAAPGDQIALRYLENGHVTLVQGVRPAHNGTVFIYGTKTPANTDTYLGIHRVWNTAGTGGDKRGKLIATRNFDDGKCFQVNGSPLSAARKAAVQWTSGSDLECQTDVQIPEEAGTSGNYTMYWVWEWPTLNPTTGAIVTNQSYTSCLDIMMTSTSQAGGKVSVSSNQALGLNAAVVAVQKQLDNQFLVDPTATPVLTAGAEYTMAPSPVASSTHAATSQSSSATTLAASSQSQGVAANGFITVTITASAHDTATVTVTKDSAASPTAISSSTVTHTSTVQQHQATATASITSSQASSTYAAASGPPSPKPFLASSKRSLKVKGRAVN